MAKGKKFFRKEKKVVVFNEESRREYLLGFRKRKNERRTKANEEIQKKAKDKMKGIKAEKKKEVTDRLQQHKEELEALASDSDDGQEAVDRPDVNATYDHPEQVVTVTTIIDVDLNGGLTTIGPNKGLEDAQQKKQDSKFEENSTDCNKDSSKATKYSDSKFQVQGNSKYNKKRKWPQKSGKSKTQEKRHFKSRKT